MKPDWIKLTKVNDREIWINPTFIVSMEEKLWHENGSTGTNIGLMNAEQFIVKESMEEINRHITWSNSFPLKTPPPPNKKIK
jgi:uncharacterized protein YlzI (FlbEa/FlbD family)